ncbi:MAG: hypothetical protein IPQ07_34605 [Myxococcales bacterium]|nr:hypothetical protein [Myxococcales bacterium]
MFAIGALLVTIGFALDQSTVLTIGATLAVFALVLFIATADERAKGKLPVARELVEVVACVQETRSVNPGDLSPSTNFRVSYFEVQFEDGTRSRFEVCVGDLKRKIRRGTLELPVMAVVVTRGDELHGWYPIGRADRAA